MEIHPPEDKNYIAIDKNLTLFIGVQNFVIWVTSPNNSYLFRKCLVSFCKILSIIIGYFFHIVRKIKKSCGTLCKFAQVCHK